MCSEIFSADICAFDSQLISKTNQQLRPTQTLKKPCGDLCSEDLRHWGLVCVQCVLYYHDIFSHIWCAASPLITQQCSAPAHHFLVPTSGISRQVFNQIQYLSCSPLYSSGVHPHTPAFSLFLLCRLWCHQGGTLTDSAGSRLVDYLALSAPG